MTEPNEPPKRQRLGRPRKPPGEARTELVRVYLSPIEQAKITAYAHAHGMREAELLRQIGLGHDPRYGNSRVDPAAEAEASVEIRFRLPQAEKELLDSAARKEGLFLGAYLRKAGFERGESGLGEADSMRLLYELNAIGNNLNQAVRSLHAGSTRRQDWQALRSELDTILTKLALHYVR